MVECPICARQVPERMINEHIDNGCSDDTEPDAQASTTQTQAPNQTHPYPQTQTQTQTPVKAGVASFFTPRPSQPLAGSALQSSVTARPAIQQQHASSQPTSNVSPRARSNATTRSQTTSFVGKLEQDVESNAEHERTLKRELSEELPEPQPPSASKRQMTAFERAQPLAERMRPRTLDDVCGQELVGPDGVLRGLIETDRVPSMILWGGPGTGKTTIARLIAKTAGARFAEINSTSSGVAECKKLFAEARNELALLGRKTIIFCDEIHRFSKSQQDVFLEPVEAGFVTLIGATTENPSFKVIKGLMSRCRVFTLSSLETSDMVSIMQRALATFVDGENAERQNILDQEFMQFLAEFADGDARTALNLLELAVNLSKRPNMTQDKMKKSLTQTLVYDRAGDQHYNTISAFHKSVRGSDPHATLYYLARMLQSGEDPLFIARRMMVIASEDVGLADNSMLSLAAATYTAAEKIGMPEVRINLAHCAVALALAPKSTRAYRGLANATKALSVPGVAGLPIPMHLLNAPTRLMKEIGYGKEYKYNPNYKDGQVVQDYLPDKILGSKFLEDNDLGTELDADLIAVQKLREEAARSTSTADHEISDAASDVNGIVDKDEDAGTATEEEEEEEDNDGEQASFVVGDGNLEMNVD